MSGRLTSLRAIVSGLGLALVSLVLCVALLELAGRAAGLWRPDSTYRYDPVRGYAMAPGGEINRLGMRGAAVADAPAPGTTRLVMLGDSFTYGQGVTEADTQPRQLERVLGPGYEVVNMGVSGYNTAQQLLFWRAQGIRLRPAALLVAFTLSDAELGLLGLKDTREVWIIHVKELVKAHMGMYLWARHAINVLRERWAYAAADGVWPEVAPLRDAAEGRSSEGWDRCAAALASFAADCRALGIPCVLVIWPVLEHLDDYPYTRLHEFVTRAAERVGFTAVVDLLPTFVGRDERALQVSEADMHPNAEGHRLAAATIAAAVRPLVAAGRDRVASARP